MKSPVLLVGSLSLALAVAVFAFNPDPGAAAATKATKRRVVSTKAPTNTVGATATAPTAPGLNTSPRAMPSCIATSQQAGSVVQVDPGVTALDVELAGGHSMTALFGRALFPAFQGPFPASVAVDKGAPQLLSPSKCDIKTQQFTAASGQATPQGAVVRAGNTVLSVPATSALPGQIISVTRASTVLSASEKTPTAGSAPGSAPVVQRSVAAVQVSSDRALGGPLNIAFQMPDITSVARVVFRADGSNDSIDLPSRIADDTVTAVLPGTGTVDFVAGTGLYVVRQDAIATDFTVSVACDKGGPKDTFPIGNHQVRIFSGIHEFTNCLVTVIDSARTLVSYFDNSGNGADGRVTIYEPSDPLCAAATRGIVGLAFSGDATRCATVVLIGVGANPQTPFQSAAPTARVSVVSGNAVRSSVREDADNWYMTFNALQPCPANSRGGYISVYDNLRPIPVEVGLQFGGDLDGRGIVTGFVTVPKASKVKNFDLFIRCDTTEASQLRMTIP